MVHIPVHTHEHNMSVGKSSIVELGLNVAIETCHV